MNSSNKSQYHSFANRDSSPGNGEWGGTLAPLTDFFSGGARDDLNRGYSQAYGYLSPYQQGGMEDYNNYRNYNQDMGKMLSSYGNPADYQYSRINQSPDKLYEEMMAGYNESSDAKYAQEQSMRAANQGASASGMLGSGAYFKGLQENANDISQRDRQQYYNNQNQSLQNQMGMLNNYQNQQGVYNQNQQYLSNMGYNSARDMSGNSIKQGEGNAKIDQEGMEDMWGLVGSAVSAMM